MAFPVLDASLAWIVTGTASAPGGTTKTCGPISSVPPAGPIVCLTVVEGNGLHSSRPVGFGGLVRWAVIPVGDARSETHLAERSPNSSNATTRATRVRRAIGAPSHGRDARVRLAGRAPPGALQVWVLVFLTVCPFPTANLRRVEQTIGDTCHECTVIELTCQVPVAGRDRRRPGGYDDASHFSREYRRLFGEPPLRDAERLRGSAASRPEPAAV